LILREKKDFVTLKHRNAHLYLASRVRRRKGGVTPFHCYKYEFLSGFPARIAETARSIGERFAAFHQHQLNIGVYCGER
jgi:hypothetical protein